ncbi:MAG: hypothetical protein FJ102_15220 [Deltaproteobacteria bacterium]|nr:hypothetical protein [Deltaproteobacteria bacterium]
MLLSLLACPAVDEETLSYWTIAPTELGSPVTGGTGFDPAAGDALGAAFAQVLPRFGEGLPTWDLPMAMLEIAGDDLVADPGSCPSAQVAGDTTTYVANCRSRAGYEWTGSYSVREWDDDNELSRRDWEFDLEVVGDSDDVAFDRMELRGVLHRADGDDVAHVDSNLEATLEGYFERRGQPDDPRVTTWRDWAAAGSVEDDGAYVRVDLAATTAASAGFRLGGELAIDEGCPIEPLGTADMGEGVTASFEGAEACDACATIDGGVAACVP